MHGGLTCITFPLCVCVWLDQNSEETIIHFLESICAIICLNTHTHKKKKRQVGSKSLRNCGFGFGFGFQDCQGFGLSFLTCGFVPMSGPMPTGLTPTSSCFISMGSFFSTGSYFPDCTLFKVSFQYTTYVGQLHGVKPFSLDMDIHILILQPCFKATLKNEKIFSKFIEIDFSNFFM